MFRFSTCSTILHGKRRKLYLRIRSDLHRQTTFKTGRSRISQRNPFTCFFIIELPALGSLRNPAIRGL
jgi:hypothetical protein